MDDVMAYIVQERADIKSRVGSSWSEEAISQWAFVSFLSMVCSCCALLPASLAWLCNQPTQTVLSAKN